MTRLLDYTQTKPLSNTGNQSNLKSREMSMKFAMDWAGVNDPVPVFFNRIESKTAKESLAILDELILLMHDLEK